MFSNSTQKRLSLTWSHARVVYFKILICIETGVPEPKASVRQLTRTSPLTGISDSLRNYVLWPTRGEIDSSVIVAHICVGSRTAIVDVGHVDEVACLTVKCDNSPKWAKFTFTHQDMVHGESEPMVGICNMSYCYVHPDVIQPVYD